MITEHISWVTRQLEVDPITRDSSCKLYYAYLQHLDYDTNKSIKEFLKDMDSGKIPYIDTIGRTSRRVQADRLDLAGKKRRLRLDKELKVRDEIRKL
jgi:hypothetical protein